MNMPNQFLYERLEIAFDHGVQKPEVPETLPQNLNPAFELRPYQEEAFVRFIHCLNNDFPGKEAPLHLLFNMATGSGKTLIMAGLILYLYEQGYRNFLFFVNSTTIIEKTKDNFLNPLSSKYLFSKEIHFGGKRVPVTRVDNFEGVNENHINICFTTIQKLHSDLTTEKENVLTFENFEKERVVLLADEAHHMNVETKAQMELGLAPKDQQPNWENTVEQIFRSNVDNLLLEFTATHDYETPAMRDKYLNKVLYRYDLVDFRRDGFSKEIAIVQAAFNLRERILQALILNYYKQLVAAAHKIQLKPVILFKAPSIQKSRENKAEFHQLIEQLTANQIDAFRESDIDTVQSAFRFFDKNDISAEELAQRLKSEFREVHCLSVNSKDEQETHQIQVNTLEDEDNPIRAIFAVQKLSEGWDVLNLFDIVRCYETRNSDKKTVAEAQLIGRGARYFPFVLPEDTDRFRRKFDKDTTNELRVLEELHYHSINNSRYISEIRSALIKEGMMDERLETRELKLKDSFKETDLYKYGVVWMNDRQPRDYGNVASFADLAKLSVKQKNHEHTLRTGSGGVTHLIVEDGDTVGVQTTESRDVRVVDIERNIVQSAIARKPFFRFASLKRYFPHLTSMHEFRTSAAYLGGLSITFKGDLTRFEQMPGEKLTACCDLLDIIEAELRKQITEHEGTRNFHEKQINAIFTDKTLKFSADNPRIRDAQDESEQIVSVKDWYAFDGLYGTSEERAVVKLLSGWIEAAENPYEDIYLLRNERHFSLYNFFDGRTFQPDFVLFLHQSNEVSHTYQLFIEPKGAHLEAVERWKADFLKEIRTECGSRILTQNNKYRVIGVPTFYNQARANEFKAKLGEVLEDTYLVQGSDD